MKVIDLYNKIANDEEVPKELIYHGYSYIYCTNIKDYKKEDSYNEEFLFDIINSGLRLNDEIEILEEDKEEKKIPDKLSTWFSLDMPHSKKDNIEYANANFENMYEKINEIIDCLDYLKNKGDE